MTDPTLEPLPLATEFPTATREQWLKLVDRVLKGAPFAEKLVGKSYDGLAIEPLSARRPDARPVPGRAASAPWQILQRIDHPANAQALHDLENGATGLLLVGAGSIGAHGFGLSPDAGTIERVLDGVQLDAGIAIEFDLSPQTKDLPLALAALIKRRGINPRAIDIRFGFDPLGASALAGGFPLPWHEFVPLAAGLARNLAQQGFDHRIVAVDGRIIHNAGGSEAQELAYMLAAATEILRTFEAGGFTLDDARRAIFYRLTADAEQFLTIAKFRALRKLLARVEEACGLATAPVFVTAETAWRTMTKRDPHVNILRATIAAFAAAVGGANAISVLPFTLPLSLPDGFARRLARNTQLLLMEEAHLAKVADPAAGSGSIEDLTEKLCRSAWALFQDIESAGGAATALEQGLIQRKVAAVRAARQAAMGRRTESLTGTSNFPSLDETPVAVLDVAPVTVAPMPVAVPIEPLPSVRLAEPFEELRDASDRLLAQTGSRPRIFLANLGRAADFVTRATFARNFFEAGGIETVAGDGDQSVDNLVKNFRASGATLACLCSSDAIYGARAAAAVQALVQAGARHIYLVGRPDTLGADLRSAGVQTFVHPGCDALGILQAAHAMVSARSSDGKFA